MSRAVRQSVLAAAIFAGLTAGFHARLLFLDHVLVNPDGLDHRDPLRACYAGELKQGRLATWCPTEGLGLPLLAESQMGMLHPLNLAIFSLTSAGRGDTVLIVAACFLAGLFAYWFARSIGTGFAGGVLAGVAFMFSGFFAAQEGQVWARSCGVHLPLILLCAEQTAGRRGWRGAWWAAVAVGLALLAGHYHLTFQAMLAFGVYVLWRRCQRCGGVNGLRRAKTWALAAGPLVVALGLAAPQLLPTAELKQRSDVRDMDPALAALNSCPPHHLAGYVLPHLFRAGAPVWDAYWDRLRTNYWESTAYAGFLPLFLAVLAWRRRRLCPAVRPLVGLAIGFTLLSFGRWLPGYGLLQRLPGFGWFRAPGRYVFGASLCVAALAGLGLDEAAMTVPVVARRRFRAFLRFAVWAVVLATAVGAVICVAVEPASWRVMMRGWALSLGVVVLSGVAFGFLVRRRRGAVTLAVLVTILDVTLYARSLEGYDARVLPRADLENTGPVVRTLTSAGNPPPRVAGPGLSWLAATGAVPLHFYTGFSPLRPEWVNELVQGPYAEAANVYRTYNVGYVLSFEPVTDDRLRLVFAGVDRQVNVLARREPDDVAYLYTCDSLPRAFVVREAVWRRSDADIRHRLLRGDVVLGRTVLLEGPRRSAPATADGPCSCRISRYRPTEVRVDVDAGGDAPVWLVLSDLYYPGWEAHLADGRGLVIERANALCRAVRVPPGRHTVAFAYRPASFRWGVTISAATAAGLLLAGAGSATARLRARRGEAGRRTRA